MILKIRQPIKSSVQTTTRERFTDSPNSSKSGRSPKPHRTMMTGRYWKNAARKKKNDNEGRMSDRSLQDSPARPYGPVKCIPAAGFQLFLLPVKTGGKTKGPLRTVKTRVIRVLFAFVGTSMCNNGLRVGSSPGLMKRIPKYWFDSSLTWGR